MPSTLATRLVPLALAVAIGCGSANADRPIAPLGPASMDPEVGRSTPAAPPVNRTARIDGGSTGPAEPPSLDGGSTASSSDAPPAPVTAPPASDGAVAAPLAPPLGPFDPHSLPKTKLALIMSVDSALRAADPAAIGRIWLDDSYFGKLCPGVPAAERAELAAEQTQSRKDGAAAFAECLALADWSTAERLALNYGSRTDRVDSICAYDYLGHESSELFYVLGDTVYKVKIYGAIATGGRHALSGRIRCSKKKPGSASEAKQVMHRLGRRCPGVPWPRLTQIRRGCPRL